jgi:hypothetical protein
MASIHEWLTLEGANAELGGGQQDDKYGNLLLFPAICP